MVNCLAKSRISDGPLQVRRITAAWEGQKGAYIDMLHIDIFPLLHLVHC